MKFCLITLAGTLLLVPHTLPAATVTIRSGNGPVGGSDSLVHVLTGPSTGGFNRVFSPNDFAAAQTGPAAFIVAPNSLWLSTLSADPGAKWISSVSSSFLGNTALYAVSFQIPDAFIVATLALNYAADDGIGDGGANGGIYLNGSAVCGNSSPTGFNQEHSINCGDITQFLHAGTNWLYVENGNALSAAGLLFSATVATTSATGPVVTVPGTAMPWRYAATPGALNYNSPFGLNDGMDPVVVSSANGIGFIPGSTVTLKYMSGTVSIGPELKLPYTDARGISQAANNTNQGATGKAAPSNYMDPATYPIYYGELVGTFAGANGSIIGAPFAIGAGSRAVTIPAGANQIQLGVNDDDYANNVGSWSVQVATTVQQPVLSNGGIVNSTTLTPGGPVAAGSISSLLGVFPVASPALSPGTGAVWPTTLGGLSIKIAGIPAPLFYVSNTLVHFQVPWELTGVTQADVTVTAHGQVSLPQTANLAIYAPGLYAINGEGTGQGAVLDASYRIIDASNPTKPGAYIQLYGTGLGPVTNQPPTGMPEPSSPYATTPALPGVTIGGIAAPVLFSGLLPTGIGYYQINVQVPDGVLSGNSVPVILSIGGVTSNTVTIAVQSSVPPNPAPAITSLSPSSAVSGTGPLTLTITGSGFVAASTAMFCTVPHAVTFVDVSHLRITLSATDLGGTGACAVVVSNPVPGGGVSGAVSFPISAPSNPAPTITSLSPSSSPLGSGPLTLTINGTGFTTNTSVTFNGYSYMPSFQSGSQITITLPKLSVPGSFPVVISSPPPGGGSSSPATFVVTLPPSFTLSGNWKGAWGSVPSGIVGSLSANMTESSTSTSSVAGFPAFAVTGTLTLTSSPCFGVGLISGGLIAGDTFAFSVTFAGNQQVVLDGILDPNGTSITSGAYKVQSGLCAGDFGIFTATKN